MTPDELLEEGHGLARPCVHLTRQGSDYCGVWGGMGVVPLRDARFRHWLSVSSCAVPGEHGLTGCISVYTNQEDRATGLVLVNRQATLPPIPDGIKLYAHQATCFPPLDAIFRYGSAAVQAWLRANQWQPEWGYSSQFRDHPITALCASAYQEQLDLKGRAIDAVLGGWPMPWRVGDWEERPDRQLLLWTWRDSPPWIELWHDRGQLRVIQRVVE